jgi:hypothetical protein
MFKLVEIVYYVCRGNNNTLMETTATFSKYWRENKLRASMTTLKFLCAQRFDRRSKKRAERYLRFNKASEARL